MAFAELGDLRLHYELSGDVSMPVMVFSHSLGANLAMWEPQLHGLSSHFCVLRYDTRGHGGSSAPSGPYTIAQLGEDVLRLLDELEIQQVSFCGLSLGGVTGQWLSIHAPDRLHKLILTNTAARIGSEEMWNTRIATVLQDGLSPLIPATLERWFTPAFRSAQPQAVAAIPAMLHAADRQGYVACCAAIRDADFRIACRDIRTPTLVMTGTYDPVTPPGDAHFLTENIAGARYVELSAAHLSNMEAATVYNSEILAFHEFQVREPDLDTGRSEE